MASGSIECFDNVIQLARSAQQLIVGSTNNNQNARLDSHGGGSASGGGKSIDYKRDSYFPNSQQNCSQYTNLDKNNLTSGFLGSTAANITGVTNFSLQFLDSDFTTTQIEDAMLPPQNLWNQLLPVKIIIAIIGG